MPLLNDRCSKCHTAIFGRPKNLFLHSAYGIIADRIAAHCKKEERTKTEDKGKLLVHKQQIKNIARCVRCGRKQSGGWVTKEVEKEWKDDGCK